ncbi:MAG: hypothetical protein ACK5JE_04675 [Castellaniella sp.]|uniref:hypothetical protein n=1 Tax=Castellaniella sp. TaxID=1955812 RepID=UPI003A89B243
MISVSTETQTLAVAILIYVYDSCQLLFANEGIITKKRKEYAATTGGNGLVITGKKLFIPNLLLPHRPIYKLSWNPETIAKASVDWDAGKPAFSWLSIPAYGMFFALFILTPAIYHLSGLTRDLLWCVALIYLIPILTSIGINLHKKRLWLSNKDMLTIAAECILCPVLTINIVRKLSISANKKSNLVQSAFALLSPRQWDEFKAEIVQNIDDAILETDLEETINRLKRSRKTILEMSK